jgi:hypothetical protein
MAGVAEGLHFTATISKSVIERGDTATFHYMLFNPTRREVVLRFSSGCQMLPYVRGQRELVLPRGAWQCTMSVTTLRLAPGEVIERSQILFAGSHLLGNLTWIPIEPGDYVAYAELGFPGIAEFGRSNSAPFRVN